MKKIILSKAAIFIIISFMFISISSCHKNLPVVYNAQSYPGNNYPDLFEAFWNGMNNNYVFWSIDSTNWDNVYIRYKPIFAQLTVFDTSSENKAEKYFAQMTSGLIDSHYNLTFESTGNTFSPSVTRRYTIDPNYFIDSIFPIKGLNALVSSKYIDSSSLITGTDFIMSGSSSTVFSAISGTIGNEILYLYFNSFEMSKAGPNTTPVLNFFFNTVRNLPANIKGIIIDLRGNGGGEVIDLDYLVGQMVNAQYTFGYTRTKNGTGRLDYTPWAPAVVKPWNGGSDISVPIVALGDHLSTSMAEITTMAIKALPNGKYIGTRTWGATGPVAPDEYYNGGPFTIGVPAWGNAGYLSVYTSAAMFKYINGDIYEGAGVPPDIYASETYSAYANNHDLVVDAAINYINTH